MTDRDDSSAATRRRHIVRLIVFAAFLFGLFYLVAVTRVIDVEDVRRTVAATGPAAPLIYIVVSAVLGAVFVPGPILAAGSGVLFGPVLGLFVTLGATVGTAIITSLIGRRAGRDSARALLGARACRTSRPIHRTARTVGSRRSAVHPRPLGCARLLRVGRVRSSVVADGRRSVHRVGAASVRLHDTGRVDFRPVIAVGLRGDRGLVRDRDHRRRSRRITATGNGVGAHGSTNQTAMTSRAFDCDAAHTRVEP